MEIDKEVLKKLAVDILSTYTVMDSLCTDERELWNRIEPDDEYEVNTLADDIERFFKANQPRANVPQLIEEINSMNNDKPENNTESAASCSGHIEPAVSCDELQIICDTVVKLTELKLNKVGHLCIQNFAQQCLGNLLSELKLNKDGLLRVPDDVMHESN